MQGTASHEAPSAEAVAIDRDRDRETSNFRKHTSGNPLQRALIARFHRAIARQVVALEPASFLDAGCGEGFVARALLSELPDLRLVGCDLSPVAARLAADQNPNADFVAASVLRLPFGDNAFDVVGCFEVLEHLPGAVPEQALREFARIARRAVVLSVPHEPYFSLANAARGKNLNIRPRGSDPDHRQFWSRRAFGTTVGQTMDLRWLGGAFPWTICVAAPKP
ncbi:MAG: class I SAM-dependent methyltransferase [Chloroflexota bacterium]|nr:class I SAM-dependent methyltransferase [Chloroflexia bacterium]MDQ3466616.1 class I SAM-dependent methyltransferase [Chloroflexota bacterium]